MPRCELQVRRKHRVGLATPTLSLLSFRPSCEKIWGLRPPLGAQLRPRPFVSLLSNARERAARAGSPSPDLGTSRSRSKPEARSEENSARPSARCASGQNGRHALRQRTEENKTQLKPLAASICVQLDAQQLFTDEDVVAVRQGFFGLQAQVRAVAAVEVGEHELAVFFLDGGVLALHEHVTRKVEVAVFATDLQRVATRADGHSDRPAFENLIQAEGAGVLG
jgi:hypothetical protein